MVVKIVHDELVDDARRRSVPIDLNAPPPVAIMMVGLQGSGKTTTTGKIAKRLQETQNKKVLMASLDTRRPAAQEQLRQLGEADRRRDVAHSRGPDAGADRQPRGQAAKLGGYDVVMLDTAGRTIHRRAADGGNGRSSRPPTRMKSCLSPMR